MYCLSDFPEALSSTPFSVSHHTTGYKSLSETVDCLKQNLWPRPRMIEGQDPTKWRELKVKEVKILLLWLRRKQPKNTYIHSIIYIYRSGPGPRIMFEVFNMDNNNHHHHQVCLSRTLLRSETDCMYPKRGPVTTDRRGRCFETQRFYETDLTFALQ